MTEVLFYHLERQALEEALPPLLGKCLERGWRAVVQVADEEFREALNAYLWTWRDDSFLPHGSASDGYAERQPIWLTCGGDNPNRAEVRFLGDRATIEDVAAYRRVVYLFNGRDEEAVAEARTRWQQARSAGHDVTYWRQSSQGRWQKQG